MTGVFSSLTPGPSITRSWPMWPSFVRSNVYLPGERLVLGSSILNSDSLTGTLFGAVGAVVETDPPGVVPERCVVEGVVVGGGGGAAVEAGGASAPVDPPSARPSLGSRPKKKTANIIPTKSAAVSRRDAGTPRLPGACGRRGGIK